MGRDGADRGTESLGRRSHFPQTSGREGDIFLTEAGL